MSKLLTLDQAAELINCPKATLRYWLVNGEAPKSFKLGRRRMFKLEDVEAWIELQVAKSATDD